MMILPAASRRRSPAAFRPVANVLDERSSSAPSTKESFEKGCRLQKNLIERENDDKCAHGKQIFPRLARQAAYRTPLPALHTKCGNVLKLTAHLRWVSKTITLSHTQLVIADEDNNSQDYILLHEILSVKPSSAHVNSSFMRGDSGPGSTSETKIAPDHGTAYMMRKMSLQMSLPKAKSTRKQCDVKIFEIHTKSEETHADRIFTFKTDSYDDCAEWIEILQKESKRRMQEVRHQTVLARWRDGTRKVFEHDRSQAFMGLLIVFNFGINAYQAEYHPATMISPESEGGRAYMQMDIMLTSIFVGELAVNLFCNWFWPFISNGWNLFDFLIVTFSLLSLLVAAMPGLNFLRVLRALRLIRVIRRFKSLKRIFGALIKSIIPVLNAFAIGAIITSIYAITGVYLFQEESPQTFGTFSLALISLFMLVGLGRWGDDAPLILDDEGTIRKTSLLFLFSFVAIVLWTCLQVVVAAKHGHLDITSDGDVFVKNCHMEDYLTFWSGQTGHVGVQVLLDNFLSATQEDKRAEAIKHQQEHRKQGSPLDPLLQMLTNQFDSEDDLEKDIHAVFKILDVDGSGGLSHAEMVEGFEKLKLRPRIKMSVDDLKSILEHSLGHIGDEVTLKQFEKMIWIQMRSFTQQAMHDAVAVSDGDPVTSSILWAMKLNLVQDKTNNVECTNQRLGKMQEQMDTIQTEMRTIVAGKMQEQMDSIQTIVALLQQKDSSATVIAPNGYTPHSSERLPQCDSMDEAAKPRVRDAPRSNDPPWEQNHSSPKAHATHSHTLHPPDVSLGRDNMDDSEAMKIPLRVPRLPRSNGSSRRSPRKALPDIPAVLTSNSKKGSDSFAAGTWEGIRELKKFTALDGGLLPIANSRSFETRNPTKDCRKVIIIEDVSCKMQTVQADLGHYQL